jgi:hypothetical protein
MLIRQYLLAQHSHVCLELEKSLKSHENSKNYIQYANELWTSTVFLSNTIVTKARNKLFNSSGSKTSTKILIDTISAIYLLENVSLQDFFKEFLSTRTVSKTIKPRQF